MLFAPSYTASFDEILKMTITTSKGTISKSTAETCPSKAVIMAAYPHPHPQFDTISFEFEGWQTHDLDDDHLATFDSDTSDNEDDSESFTSEGESPSRVRINEHHINEDEEDEDDNENNNNNINCNNNINNDQRYMQSIFSEDQIAAIHTFQHSVHPHFSTYHKLQIINIESSSSNSEKDFSDSNYESESSCTSYADSHDNSIIHNKISTTSIATNSAKKTSSTITFQYSTRHHTKDKKSSKKVRFTAQTSIIGMSEYDDTEIPNQKTFHELCNERRLLDQNKVDGVYSPFDSDPEFKDIELLTRRLTKLNESLSKIEL